MYSKLNLILFFVKYSSRDILITRVMSNYYHNI